LNIAFAIIDVGVYGTYEAIFTSLAQPDFLAGDVPLFVENRLAGVLSF
jgi:hypothetical protein